MSAEPLDSLRAAVLSSAAVPVVLIDGQSGSGKSTLARALVAGWPEAQLIRLDDVYPGWDGLDAASEQVHSQVLEARDTGRVPRWQRWDWERDRPAEWHEVDPARPIVVEGGGSLSRANRALASFGVWVILDEATRKHRALSRDGETYAPHWERWAAQERRFARREHPAALADVVVDGLLIAGC
ncbi:MAG: nucleoside/nucleotide kinase family protein [Lacisediminihabitans sp.]